MKNGENRFRISYVFGDYDPCREDYPEASNDREVAEGEISSVIEAGLIGFLGLTNSVVLVVEIVNPDGVVVDRVSRRVCVGDY